MGARSGYLLRTTPVLALDACGDGGEGASAALMSLRCAARLLAADAGIATLLNAILNLDCSDSNPPRDTTAGLGALNHRSCAIAPTAKSGLCAKVAVYPRLLPAYAAEYPHICPAEVSTSHACSIAGCG